MNQTILFAEEIISPTDNLYAAPRLETYDVGGHKLTRVAGLKPVHIRYRDRAGRLRKKASLEASISPADYPTPRHNRQRLVIAFGAGTDSMAMLILLNILGHRPDVILWADTGSERQHTYAYLATVQRWLKSVKFPPLCIVRRRCPSKGYRGLFEQLWTCEQLPSPVFHQNHSCSISWKLTPQRAYYSQLNWLNDDYRVGIGFASEETNRRGQLTNQIAEMVGFSAEETGRRSYATDSDSGAGYQTFYPLIENGIDRAKAVEMIRAAGLPQPGKSACFFCPMSKLCELQQMRNSEPANLSAAMALETRFDTGKNGPQQNPANRISGLMKSEKRGTWRDWMANLTPKKRRTNDQH